MRAPRSLMQCPFIYISGGPGASKTTLLVALRRAGFAGADEALRQLIRKRVGPGQRAGKSRYA